MARRQLRRWAVPAVPAGLLALMLGAVWAEQLSRYHGGVEWFLGRVQGNAMTVAVRGDACDRIDHVETDETPTQVTVAVIREAPARTYVCPQQGTVRCSTVELDAPLGARLLLHAPVDAAPAGIDPYPLIRMPDDVRWGYRANC